MINNVDTTIVNFAVFLKLICSFPSFSNYIDKGQRMTFLVYIDRTLASLLIKPKSLRTGVLTTFFFIPVPFCAMTIRIVTGSIRSIPTLVKFIAWFGDIFLTLVVNLKTLTLKLSPIKVMFVTRLLQFGDHSLHVELIFVTESTAWELIVTFMCLRPGISHQLISGCSTGFNGSQNISVNWLPSRDDLFSKLFPELCDAFSGIFAEFQKRILFS